MGVVQFVLSENTSNLARKIQYGIILLSLNDPGIAMQMVPAKEVFS